MPLRNIIADIRRLAAEKLQEHGLEVVGLPSQQPESEDDEIVFRRQDGRTLLTQLQVSSLTKTGLWSESAISIYFYDNKPLGSTGFVSRRLEGVKHVDLNGSVEKCVKLLMDEIEKTQLALEPIDDLEEKVVTDGRMPGIIETFEEVQEWLTGSSEIRFTKNDKHIDQVGLLCDGTDFIDVRLEGYRATIKNVRENSEKTVAGVTDIQAAIKDLAKASFSEAPNI